MGDFWQFIGTSLVGLLGLALLHIAATGLYCRYAREALLVAATYLLTATVVRYMALAGIIGAMDARLITGFMAGAFLIVILEVVYLDHLYHARSK